MKLAEVSHHPDGAGEADHHQRLHHAADGGGEILVDVLHSELGQHVDHRREDRRSQRIQQPCVLHHTIVIGNRTLVTAGALPSGYRAA